MGNAARKIQRRKKKGGPAAMAQQVGKHAETLSNALTELQSLEGLAGLAALPGKVDELRQLIEALVDDYEGVARRQHLLFDALVALADARGLDEFDDADRILRELGREFAALESEVDEGSECQE